MSDNKKINHEEDMDDEWNKAIEEDDDTDYIESTTESRGGTGINYISSKKDKTDLGSLLSKAESTQNSKHTGGNSYHGKQSYNNNTGNGKYNNSHNHHHYKGGHNNYNHGKVSKFNHQNDERNKDGLEKMNFKISGTGNNLPLSTPNNQRQFINNNNFYGNKDEKNNNGFRNRQNNYNNNNRQQNNAENNTNPDLQPPSFLNSHAEKVELIKDDRELRAEQNRRRIVEEMERQKNKDNGEKIDIERPVFIVNEKNEENKDRQFKEIGAVDVSIFS